MIQHPVNVPVGNDQYVLVQDYICPVSGVIVRKDFVYDGASVNRLLWTITGIRPDGPFRAGATVHDWIYRHGGHVEIRDGETIRRTTLSRRDADRIFRDLLVAAGVGCLQAYLAWCGVRCFGWYPWKTYDSKEQGIR